MVCWSSGELSRFRSARGGGKRRDDMSVMVGRGT